ncbi:hypothetical protein [Novipirellula maiorica]|nr:hypothetical protein [Rhodopirellula maiorica]
MKGVPMMCDRFMTIFFLRCPQRMIQFSLLIAVAFGLPNAVRSQVNAAEPAVFRAGAAKVKITPPLGLEIVGNWNRPPATHIHDDLHVRCLALSDGTTTIAFAICDNVGIPRDVFDAARKLIDSETDVPSANVLMSATHTHSAVSARADRKVDGVLILDSYQSLLARRIADGIASAVAKMQPAKIGWGGVNEASEVHNRRWYVKDEKLLTNPFGGVDKVRMNPPRGSDKLVEPAGPIDPEVSFLSVQSLDGKPIALLANYSLHYVGGVPSGDVSADYFGAFAEKIGKRIGADAESESFVGIMTNGTSGDVNNIAFREKSAKHEPYQRINEVSNLIVQRVADAYKEIKHHEWVSLSAASQELELQMRKPDPEMMRYFASLQDAGQSPANVHRLASIYGDRVSKIAEGPETSSILLQAFRIGDLGIVAIPFEVFAETGLDLKKRSPTSDTFTIELANGSYGYLPTPAQHKLGGYETWLGTNRVQLDASDRISDVLLSLLDQMGQK